MSSPRPKVNPPLCGICMSSVDVRQEPDGGWHCRKQRCFRQRTYKPIMVTEIEKDEPVSMGLMNRLWAFMTRDIDEDRRPKHPRPEYPGGLRSPKDTGAPRPKPPQPAPRKGEGYRPRSSGDGPRCGPPKRSTARANPPQGSGARVGTIPQKEIDVGRPPSGGSGALPAPPPDCIYCEVGRVVETTKSNAFEIGRYHCKACDKEFTEEDIIKAKKTPVERTTDAVKAIAHAARTMGMSVSEATHAFERLNRTININVAGVVGNEAELVKALEESIEDSDDELLEEDYGATMRAYREERNRCGGVPMYPEDKPSSDPEKKDQDSLPTERGWSKRETKPEPETDEPAPETSSARWTAIKWIIGVGASIGLGWIAEWAFF